MKKEKINKFNSIPLFPQLARDIKAYYEWVGKDKNGDNMYDNSRLKPILKFKGTVKLHGSNAGVALSDNLISAQSRTNKLTLKEDNIKFASFVNEKMDVFKTLFGKIEENEPDINLRENDVVIFGEWAGKGIQKGVAINNIDKSFFIFGVKVIPTNVEDDNERELKSRYLEDYSYLGSPEDRIYNINDFKTFELTIDFNNPKSYIDRITEFTQEVENECPVASQLGYSGVGEGIVWVTENYTNKRWVFKSKGEEHARKKTPQPKEVDPLDNEKMVVANQLTPSWRLSQGLEEVCNLNNGGVIDKKDLGVYLKWIVEDIKKEEGVSLFNSKFTLGDLSKHISLISKTYFLEEEIKSL